MRLQGIPESRLHEAMPSPWHSSQTPGHVYVHIKTIPEMDEECGYSMSYFRAANSAGLLIVCHIF